MTSAMKNILKTSLVLGALTACDNGGSGGSNGIQNPPTPNVPTTPTGEAEVPVVIQMERFAQSQAACQNTGVQDIGEFYFDSYVDGINRVVTGSIPSLGSENGLSTDRIFKVEFGQVFEAKETAEVDFAGDIKEINEGEKVEKQAPKTLYICDTSVSDNTLEDHALTSIQHVHAAAQFYDDLGSLPIEDVKINMFPETKTELEITNADSMFHLSIHPKLIYYKTDNATYSRDEDKEPVITVLPRGVRDGEFLGERLWTSPFVMAHEYGHHVFDSLGLRSLDSSIKAAALKQAHVRKSKKINVLTGKSVSNLSMKDISRLSEGHNYQSNMITENTITELTSSLSTLHEGFADIFGFYANQQATGLSTGFAGLEGSRDVESEFFSDYSKKELTTGRLYDLLNQSGEFADSHMVGAVFAYGFDQLLHQEGLRTSEEKAKEVVAWAKELNEIFWDIDRKLTEEDDSVGGPYLLKAALNEFIRMLDEDGTRLSLGQCQAIRDIFPALVSKYGSQLEISDWAAGLNETYQCN